MLDTQLKKYMKEFSKKQGSKTVILLCKQELDYTNRHPAFFKDERESLKLIEADNSTRFANAYIERADKQTDETLAVESPEFLQQPLTYLKKHKREYLYTASDWYDVIGIDGISLELDDVFGHYNCMLGLKLQKKYGPEIQAALDSLLAGEGSGQLMFEGNEGIWDVNFALNQVPGYHEDMVLLEAFILVYEILFALMEKLEQSMQQ
ncbi:hypothetical protein [Heyndrickxia acidiproducens]|uniref:hypothetical protein n=1 Tax=Heyndrickxia acidiproducens TaxID=1121084 RepID=UPI0003648583|nr:hypothetical protein [Heyndrickxia acidiproducens]